MLKVQAHSNMAYLKSSNESMKSIKIQVEIEIFIPNMKKTRTSSKQLLELKFSSSRSRRRMKIYGFWVGFLAFGSMFGYAREWIEILW